MDKKKFAIIGLGNIGKRHAKHIIANPFAELVSVCDIQENKMDMDELKGVKKYNDPSLFFAQCDADVVNICTPNYLHHHHTIEALQHQKNVVCEKPMAMSVKQCDEMIQAANQNKRVIFVVKQNRYNEPVKQVKKLLEEQILGKIYFVNINCFWNRGMSYYNENDWRGKKSKDGGCLFTQFSHFVDILYYLFGEIADCRGVIQNMNHPDIEIEDTGAFIMHSKNGAIINFNFSTCSYEKNLEGAITIIAENGSVKIGGQYLNTIEYQHIKNKILPQINIQSKANDYGQYQGSMSNHDKIIENVINHLNGQEQIMTNAFEGKKVIEMIEMMYNSVY
ncbi:MAG TPA: Gfo/Idh/MocA family oxidoreductase [Chitinophagaceae bacterium]|nr:MAG: putative dehydrogenase [Bacteroidetes bacterium OLB11]HMN32754.1 Gfo/Idh/MocA family oxidoreductase [Chitinophagaceae bacterium]